MPRGVPETNRTVRRRVNSLSRAVPSQYRQRHTSIARDPSPGRTHVTDASSPGISPIDAVSAALLSWWNEYIAGPWERRKTEDEAEEFETILEGFQRIILGEKFVAEEVIGGVTYEEGSTVPKPAPENFEDDTLTATNTEPRTWQDLIEDILAILPEEFWIGLDYFKNAVHTLIDGISNAIATAAGRIERGDGDWGNSAQRFFFGEKTTQVIRYGEDDTAGSFASGTLLDWVLTEPERSELTKDNTVARDFFEFLTSIGLDALGKFLKPIWEAIKDFGNSVISGIANAIASVGAWWESLGEGVADAIKLVGEWWEGLDQTIRDGINTAVEWVTDAVGKIREILEDLSKGFWKGVDNFTDAVEETVEDVWTWLNDVGAEIQKTLNSWGSTVWTNLTNFGNAAKAAIDRAYTWLSDATEATIKWLSGLGSTIRGRIVSAGNWVANALGNIQTAINNWWSGVLGSATSLGVYVLNSITTWWAGIDLGSRISDALGDSWDAITKWWADVPFHRGGTNYIDGLQRVLYGEIFTQFVRVDNRFVARPNDVVTSTNQSYAVGWENLATRNTRARTFAEYLTANIDALLTTANDVVTGVAAGIQGFFTDISKVLFGGSIIPAAYASTGDDTPETFVDDRNKHWFATLLDQLNPGNLLDEAVNGIQDFIDGIVDWFTGGGDVMGANIKLSNLGDVEINKPLNFDENINTVGSNNKRNIGFDGNNMYIKTKTLGSFFFQSGSAFAELKTSGIKFQTAGSNPGLGEISQVSTTNGLTLKAQVYRGANPITVDFADIGTGVPTAVSLTIDPISDITGQIVGQDVRNVQANASYNGDGTLTWSIVRTIPNSASSGSSRWISISSSRGLVVIGSPPSVPSGGSVSVTIQVTDGTLTATESFNIYVAAALESPIPNIISNRDEIGNGVQNSFTATISNPTAAGAVRWSKITGPSWVTISDSGFVRMNPSTSTTRGGYDITFEVENNAGSNRVSFKIEVINAPVSVSVPIIKGISAVSVKSNNIKQTHTPTLTNAAQAGAVRWSLSEDDDLNIPSWMSINRTSGVIAFTPPTATYDYTTTENNSIKVGIVAENDAGSDDEEFFINLLGFVRLTDPNDVEIEQGSEAEVRLSGDNGGNGGTPSYSIVRGDTDWIGIQGALITISPESTTRATTYTLVVRYSVEDAPGVGYADQAFTITVTAKAVVTPISLSLDRTSVTIQQGLATTVSATGSPSGGMYELASNPSFVSITPAGTISIAPTTSNSRVTTYSFSVRYTEGGRTATESMSVTVTAVAVEIIRKTRVKVAALSNPDADDLTTALGGGTGAIGIYHSGSSWYLAVLGVGQGGSWNIFSLSSSSSVSYNGGTASTSNQRIQTIDRLVTPFTSVASSIGTMVIDTHRNRGAVNMGIRSSSSAIWVATTTDVRRTTTDVVVQTSGRFRCTVASLTRISGSGLDSAFGNQLGSIGFNTANNRIYIRGTTRWYYRQMTLNVLA